MVLHLPLHHQSRYLVMVHEWQQVLHFNVEFSSAHGLDLLTVFDEGVTYEAPIDSLLKSVQILYSFHFLLQFFAQLVAHQSDLGDQRKGQLFLFLGLMARRSCVERVTGSMGRSWRVTG